MKKCGAGREDTSDERIDDAMHVKGRKRTKKATAFWTNKNTPGVLMSAGIVSFPVRKLLGRMLAAEKEARIAQFLHEELSSSLLGGFVKSGGHFDEAAERRETLLDNDSPLLEDMCSVSGEHEDAVERNRGMVLRLKASMEWRILRRTRRKTSFFEMVRTPDENTQESKDGFCSGFMGSSLKYYCLEPYSDLRTRNEFKRLEGGARSALDKSAPFAKAVTWTASSAPLFMISARETDHAALSNKLNGSKHWQQGVLVPAQVQMLEKWRQMLPLRVAKQEGLFDKPGEKRNMLNQYSAADNKVSNVVKLVDGALQKCRKSRDVGQRLSGLFLVWRSAPIRHAKLADSGRWSVEKAAAVNNELLETLASMPAGQQTVAKVGQLGPRASA